MDKTDVNPCYLEMSTRRWAMLSVPVQVPVGLWTNVNSPNVETRGWSQSLSGVCRYRWKYSWILYPPLFIYLLVSAQNLRRSQEWRLYRHLEYLDTLQENKIDNEKFSKSKYLYFFLFIYLFSTSATLVAVAALTLHMVSLTF